MAKTKLSAATYVEKGYGQVEPNHLSAQRTGEIYAQLPCDAAIKVLENGMFMKYDYANGVVNTTGAGEWMLVYNEVKLYDEREVENDFAMIKENYAAGEIVPRLFKTHEGDIFTTNCVKEETLAVKDELVVEADGYLVKAGESTGSAMKWQVVKVTTMPDGQKAVKLMRIA